ncbi:serine/arginine-rich splicing factor 3a isoform X2 [Centropristis striata]|uniref:serine/arginine-rich splicing factor 3a isoform X2 n=1 Tax=Centropristis striata TaxID=184440 RepID=UPI0027E2084D|nr:serine/arginine-rich splicing factor 3a isoform X2 [Centropristis striata]
MSQTESFPLDCKVYVGNLGNNGNKSEIESAFGYYGPLRSVWVARNPPGFAFVEFEDPRDASDAVKELDGRSMCGCRVRVELSNGEKRSRSRGGPATWSGRRPRDDFRRRSPPVRRRSLSRERDRCRHRSLSRDKKGPRSISRSRSRSRSNGRK